MAIMEPVTELDARFSSPDATPVDWAVARDLLATAETYWLSTVRPDGRPHVTPLVGVWLDHALYFCTGPTERKARNLEDNAAVAVTTGSASYHEGMDVVLEGTAVQVTDDARLLRIAGAYDAKYGGDWHFEVADGAFQQVGGNIAYVYEVFPVTTFGFGKGAVFSQTRWRFPTAG